MEVENFALKHKSKPVMFLCVETSNIFLSHYSQESLAYHPAICSLLSYVVTRESKTSDGWFVRFEYRQKMVAHSIACLELYVEVTALRMMWCG